MMRLKLKEYKIDKKRLPKSLIVYGVFYASLVLIMSLLILFIFPIQERVSGKVEILSLGLPMEVKAKSEGRLFLLVDHDSQVKKNQLVASIMWKLDKESHDQLLSLINNQYNFNLPSDIRLLKQWAQDIDASVNLPGLQGNIQEVISSVEKYELLIYANNPEKIIQSLEQEITDRSGSIQLYDSLRVIKEQKITLIEKQLLSDSILYVQGGISEREYEKRKTELLDEEESKVNNSINKRSTISAVNELNSQITTIQTNYQSQIALFKTGIQESLNDLRKKYYEISDEKLIRAPLGGRVSKDPDVLTGNEVAAGDDLFKIVPDEKKKQQAFLYIGFDRAGEVKPGQKLFIRLDEFPSKQYGVLSATISAKDPIPRSNLYRIYLQLNYPLVTDFGYRIDERPLYHGKGEVYTRRMNIFNKILMELKSTRADLMRNTDK